MELNMNLIYHNYITKIVLVSVFLYKGKVRKPVEFQSSVKEFCEKRLPWKIGLIVDTGKKLEKNKERMLLINSLLNDIETDYLSSIMVSFTTPLKRTIMRVDLNQEEKYKKFIYS